MFKRSLLLSLVVCGFMNAADGHDLPKHVPTAEEAAEIAKVAKEVADKVTEPGFISTSFAALCTALNPVAHYGAWQVACDALWNRGLKAARAELWKDHRSVVVMTAAVSTAAALAVAEYGFNHLVTRAFARIKKACNALLS